MLRQFYKNKEENGKVYRLIEVMTTAEDAESAYDAAQALLSEFPHLSAGSVKDGRTIRDSIDRACKDETDRRIVDLLMMQYTRREIAERVGMSHTAVNKRVNALRDRYRDGDSTSAGYGMAYAPMN